MFSKADKNPSLIPVQYSVSQYTTLLYVWQRNRKVFYLKALIGIVRGVTRLANMHICAKLAQDMMYTSLQVNKLSSHF